MRILCLLYTVAWASGPMLIERPKSVVTDVGDTGCGLKIMQSQIQLASKRSSVANFCLHC